MAADAVVVEGQVRNQNRFHQSEKNEAAEPVSIEPAAEDRFQQPVWPDRVAESLDTEAAAPSSTWTGSAAPDWASWTDLEPASNWTDPKPSDGHKKKGPDLIRKNFTFLNYFMNLELNKIFKIMCN